MITMKRLTSIMLISILAVSVASAQKGKVNSALSQLMAGNTEKAWTLIEQAKTHPKAVDWPKTYYVRGRILQQIGESKDDKIKNLVENPLQKAWNDYQKALKLDEKDRINKDVDLQMATLQIDFINKGINMFNAQKYKEAFGAFQNSLEVGKMPIFNGAVDTSIIYNAALAANNAGMYDEAIKYYKKAKDLDYGGASLYLYMKNAYLAKNDSTDALNILKEGFEKYPDNSNIIVELVNYYLTSGESQQAMEYLQLAKKNDPTNASLYFAEGTLHEKMGNPDKAMESYKKAIEVDSTFFNAYYNLGVLFFNKSVKLYEKANEIMDNDKYAKAKAEADEVLNKAIPYMEKAHQLNPKDVSTMETLKMIYYRLQMKDKLEDIQKQLDAAKAAGGSSDQKK